MKTIVYALLASLLMLGCSSSPQTIKKEGQALYQKDKKEYFKGFLQHAAKYYSAGVLNHITNKRNISESESEYLSRIASEIKKHLPPASHSKLDGDFVLLRKSAIDFFWNEMNRISEENEESSIQEVLRYNEYAKKGDFERAQRVFRAYASPISGK